MFFNISTLAKGVYFLKIGTDRATVMRKIVVE
ncbi:MAG: T9SS type A sorting domain-containing protein [Bacteroidales bacterium]|nr:T9SS type A sorting domain-containing protein [Bacteroidales bacterium]